MAQIDIKNNNYNILKTIQNMNGKRVLRIELKGKEYIVKIYSYVDEDKYKKEVDNHLYVMGINKESYEKYVSALLDHGRLENKSFYLLFEAADHDVFDKAGTMSPSELIYFINSINEILNFFHDNNIIHTDIKTENILYYEKENIYRICDLDSILRENLTMDDKQKGTFDRRDPFFNSYMYELTKKYIWNKLSDDYAFSLCVYHVLTDKDIFVYENYRTKTEFKRCDFKNPIMNMTFIAALKFLPDERLTKREFVRSLVMELKKLIN